MRTILFLFSSEASRQKNQNLVRDILYCGYDIHIETYSEEVFGLNAALENDHYLMIFTENYHLTKNKKCRRLFGNIHAMDIIKEINQDCLVFN